jgi:uncharacterized protein YprB with RNaseH-like and TPR domain
MTGEAAPRDAAAAGIRAGIGALLRGEKIGEEPPPARREHSRTGGVVEAFGGFCAFAIRRTCRDLIPGRDLDAEIAGALDSLRRTESPDPGLQPAQGMGLEDLVVLDLETAGFWGCPVFLVGMLLAEEGRLITLQLLARDYPEEAAIVGATATVLASRELLVTFNGKSFDVPFLAERALVHQIVPATGHRKHVDVLHPARRRYAGELPDCRLQTLERHVAGIHRVGDLPSAEIPAAYHAFAASGRLEELARVLHHSRVDLLATALLFAALARSNGG